MYLYRVCDRTEQKQRGGRKPERKVRNLQDPFMLQSAHFRSKLTPTYLVAFARHGHIFIFAKIAPLINSKLRRRI